VILFNVLGAAVMIAVLTASGARIRHVLRLPTPPVDRWATDLIIGAGLSSLWILALGLFGLLQLPMITGGLVLQATIGRWRGNGRPIIPLLIAVAAGLPHVMVAAGPPHFYDAMVYHLGLPWQALLEGGFKAHPEDLFSAFPPLAQMIAIPPLSLDLFRIPGIMHCWAWISAAVAAGGLSRRLGGSRTAGGLVTAAAMLLPVTPLVPGFPAAEGWFLAALIPAIGWALTRHHRKSTLVGSMLLLGLATATRIQGLVWIPILLGLPLFTHRDRTFIVRGLPLLMIGSAPWWFKNLVLLGDPLAPVFWNREGIETLWRDGAALMKTGLSPLGLVGRLPGLLFHLGPMIPVILVVSVSGAVFVRRNRPIVGAALLGMAAWTATGALPRFFAPTLLLLIIAASNLGRSRTARVASFVLVGCSLTVGLVVQRNWLDVIHPLDLLGKDFVETAPRVAPNPPFEAFRDLDGILPREAKILLVGEPRVFGVPREVIAPSQHDVSPLRNLCEGNKPATGFAEDLNRQGITHLIINDGELARLEETYPVTPWKTIRGEGRWWAFIRLLGPPLYRNGIIRTYELPNGPTQDHAPVSPDSKPSKKRASSIH